MVELAKKNLPESMAKSTLPEVLTLKLPKDGKSIAITPVALLSRDADGDGSLLFGDRLLNTTPWGTDSDGNDADTLEIWYPFNESGTYGTDLTLVSAVAGKKIELMILGFEIVGNLIVPIPPIEEQGRIVKRVRQLMSLCDELEVKIDESRVNSKELLEAVIQEVIAG